MYEGRTLTAQEEAAIAAEIEAIDQQLNQMNGAKHKSYEPRSNKVDLSGIVGTVEQKTDDEIFLTPMKIKVHEKDISRVVPSGISLLDKRIIGFNKGELSVWSGSNGSGKSSLLSQMAIESIDSGFKVALYSGELRADRVLNWIHLQCAGKKYAIGTKYENYYTVSNEIRTKINQWLDGKLYIYNNEHSSKVEEVVQAIKECIEKHRIDVLIIDNLMSLDLASVVGEKFEKQTNLVLALTNLCKLKNVVIHFITHPRKTMTFLRKNDISGTADITNAADNVFLVHRCNTDFKKSIKEYLGIKDDNPLLRYDNVIEVCKNRDLGISDEFIGLYFEKESKRFLNMQNERKIYRWEEDKDGFIKEYDQREIPFK